MLIQKIKNKSKKGFTIIELIVVLAVIAILVFIGSLAYKGYTKHATFVRLCHDARILTDASERYFINNGDYPRLADTPYTAAQVNSFTKQVYNYKGSAVTLEESGNYYDVDFNKLKKYCKVNEDYKNFILQNPVGDVYVVDPNRISNNTLTAPSVVVNVINSIPTITVTYPNGITPQVTQYQLNEDAITNSAPNSTLPTGSYAIKVRYEYNNDFSNWASIDFIVLNGAKQVLSETYDASYALMNDGTVLSWGSNEFGQLGYDINAGTRNTNVTPTKIEGLTGVKQLAGGWGHVLALLDDGTIKSWGANGFGQLGYTTTNNSVNTIPKTIPGVTGVKQVSTTYYHSLAVLNDGTVMSWGNNWNGQLGYTTVGAGNATPTVVPGLNNVKQISAGFDCSSALMNDGTIRVWGSNEFGALGTSVNLGTTIKNYTPTEVPGITNVIQVCSGSESTLCLLSNGTVAAWGLNESGIIGNSINNGIDVANPNPTVISGLSGVKRLSINNGSAIALLTDNTIVSWGSNYYGSLGRNSAYPNYVPSKIMIPSPIIDMSSGGNNALCVTDSGTIWAWGNNTFGQLGNPTNIGTTKSNSAPLLVQGFN